MDQELDISDAELLHNERYEEIYSLDEVDALLDRLVGDPAKFKLFSDWPDISLIEPNSPQLGANTHSLLGREQGCTRPPPRFVLRRARLSTLSDHRGVSETSSSNEKHLAGQVGSEVERVVDDEKIRVRRTR